VLDPVPGQALLSDSARGALSIESEEKNKVKSAKVSTVKRTKSIKAVQKEMDEFSKDPGANKLTKYKSRREQNFDDNDSEDEEVGKKDKQFQETGVIRYVDTMGIETIIKPNMRFHNYKDIFCNLIKQSSVITSYPITTMIISYDSTRAITVSKNDD